MNKDRRAPAFAALVYDADSGDSGFMEQLTRTLASRHLTVGGIIQRLGGECDDGQATLDVIDLFTGRAIRIWQKLGTGSRSCRLDTAGLADASMACKAAIDARVDVMVIDKFGNQEAAGTGLRGEIAAAIEAGVPLLVAVPKKHLDAWDEFTGGLGTTLDCDNTAVAAWLDAVL